MEDVQSSLDNRTVGFEGQMGESKCTDLLAIKGYDIDMLPNTKGGTFMDNIQP